jgi:bifunctional DNA-binding transcriptional regulator/antitoxin component of YhaV-PrlF toxin-antitoxin module
MEALSLSPELITPVPVEEALRILGFKENQFGNPSRKWGPMTVTAGVWIGCWELLLTFDQMPGGRTILLPTEIRIRMEIAPVDILGLLLHTWKGRFPLEKAPDDLRLGQVFLDKLDEEQQEYLNSPSLFAEREFFRFCIAFIEKHKDWSEADYDVLFSYKDRQLSILVEDIEVCCPARGKFDGTVTVSGRHLFRYLPKRFLSPGVLIQIHPKLGLLIGNHRLQGSWQPNSPSA